MPQRAWYKKLDTRSHFSDFWHKAKSWRDNKKIAVQNERQKLKRETEKRREEQDAADKR